MTRDQKRDLFEAVGLIAIVVSLIFLALEVRQANLATQISARDSASQGHIDYISNTLVPEILATARRKAYASEDLTDLERQQLEQFHNIRWRHYERVYFLYQRGVISEREWRGYENGILRALNSKYDFWDVGRRVFEGNKDLFSEQFAGYVEGLKSASD